MGLADIKRKEEEVAVTPPPRVTGELPNDEEDDDIYTDDDATEDLFKAVCLLDEVMRLLVDLEDIPLKPDIRSRFIETGTAISDFLDEQDVEVFDK